MITPRQLNTNTNKCTHNILSVVSGDIQSTSAAIVDKNILENDKYGYDFLELYYYVEAPELADTTPLVTIYKEFDNGEFATTDPDSPLYDVWTKGGTYPSTPITVAMNTTLVPTFVEVIFIGPGRVAIALSQCADGTRIKIGAKRVPGQLVTR